jgi:two-component system, chemotaxis family, protein-glutamate methylesterase/glutaminase
VISVLVVDDSAVIRRLVSDVLSADPAVRVVGTAPNGRIALAKVDQLRPDLVTLDVEMPVMDGVATVRELRRRHARLPVIMFSTLTSGGADATFAALTAGATDYVTKPTNVGNLAEAITSVRQQLLPRIHALCERPPAPVARPAPARPGPPARPPARPGAVKAVLIGSSTGGPEALRQVLTELPAALPVPIVVVQHMPPVFTTMLAKRLDATCKVTVVEAEHGMPLERGVVYLAPGDRHLEVSRAAGQLRTRLHDGPKENHCRPAVDVLFRSAATAFGNGALAVVLTGMGQDGRRGAEALVAAGAQVVAQDEASSVVWGMPGAVVAARLADTVLPLTDVAAYIVAQTTRGLLTAPGAPTSEVAQ